MSVTAVERQEFDQVLEEILDGLPDDVRELLDEIPLIVEDEPSPEVLKDMGIRLRPGELPDLCGMHWGTPLPERSVSDPVGNPDRILMFRGPIRRLSGGSGRQLKRQIRITLLHEIGHHFGFDEEELEELGYG
jgi:predicted Zn-dependent protease with MMP-like domain